MYSKYYEIYRYFYLFMYTIKIKIIILGVLISFSCITNVWFSSMENNAKINN